MYIIIKLIKFLRSCSNETKKSLYPGKTRFDALLIYA
jgi:hypothetical protein